MGHYKKSGLSDITLCPNALASTSLNIYGIYDLIPPIESEENGDWQARISIKFNKE